MKAAVLSFILSALLTAATPVKQVLPADSSFYLMNVINELNATSQLDKRELFGTTCSQGSLCRPVTVLFARGTIEPGNVGYLAGDFERHALVYMPDI